MIVRRLKFLVLLVSNVDLRDVDAKLYLWSSSLEDGRAQQNEGESTKGSIRDRLKSFHKNDDGDDAAAAEEALSPAEYVDSVLLYLQTSIKEMTDYLYSSDESTSSSAYARFRRSQFKDMISEPKDGWEGIISALTALRAGYISGVHSIVDGAYEVGYGTISAFLSLIQTGGPRRGTYDIPFLSELFRGVGRGASHAANAAYFLTAGAVVGTRNLLVGLYRTPEAIRASDLGMIWRPHNNAQQNNISWDYYSLDNEDRDIKLEESIMKEENLDYQKHTERKTGVVPNVRRRRVSSHVKDKRYYNLLGVETDASPREIRSAYRKEALKHHPDKQSPSASIDDEDSSLNGFLDLTNAYRTLSNEATRDAYNQHGLCFREEAILPDEGSHEEYVDLIDELFGAAAVRDYVGTVLIAPIVNEMFGFTESHDSLESIEIQSLLHRRRVVDIAKFLRNGLNAYVRGEYNMKQFSQHCETEVNKILRMGGEPTVAFLRVIGNTLSEEADRQIGLVVPFVRKAITNTNQKVKSIFANARVYAPVYFRATLESLVLGDHTEQYDTDDCSGNRTRDPVDQEAVLDLLWQYVVGDTVTVLREACDKVFADRGASDANLAFIQTPALMKYQRSKKAEALRILANAFLHANIEQFGGRGRY